MSFSRIVFKSEKQNWRTPKDVYEKLNEEFKFDFDPCPPSPKFGEHGLKISWGKSNFVNPPYRECSKWVKKSYEEACKGNICVLLIPSRTDTIWWHEFVMKASEIRFIKGRLKFGEAKNSAPFPSAIIIFKGTQAVLEKVE